MGGLGSARMRVDKPTARQHTLDEIPSLAAARDDRSNKPALKEARVALGAACGGWLVGPTW